MKALYEDGYNALLNQREVRIHYLYSFLDKDIMPWQWDYPNYSGENSDMIGFFYPEDIGTIKDIMNMESKKAKRDADEARRKAKQ